MKAGQNVPSTSSLARIAVAALCLTTSAAGVAPRGPQGEADSISVDLNIPAYRLTVRAGDSIVGEFAVAIGTRAFPTPVGDFALRKVELNPRWVPPASAWARDREPMPPGPRNPMGRAKLEFHPTYYLHGTPEPESVGSAASHGCVRLRNEDVLALARLLVGWGRPELADSVERWAMPGRGSRRIDLARAAALGVRYDLIEVRHDRIVAYPDPYRLRTDSTDAVAAVRLSLVLGVPVSRHIVTQLLDRVAARPVEVPLDSIAWEPPPALPAQE
ncbi:MAG TPA: L,D-transpeptidase [Gemmatimonadales bacterium]